MERPLWYLQSVDDAKLVGGLENVNFGCHSLRVCNCIHLSVQSVRLTYGQLTGQLIDLCNPVRINLRSAGYKASQES